MHLIVVTELVGDVCPKASRRRHLRLESGIKSDDPCVALGRETDLIGKSPLELANAQSGARSRVIDAKRAALQKKPVGDRAETASGEAWSLRCRKRKSVATRTRS